MTTPDLTTPDAKGAGSMRRSIHGLSRTAAVLALLAFVVGVPVLLAGAVGLPDRAALSAAIRTGRLDDDAVVQIGGLLFMVLWAWFALTAVSEVRRIIAWRAQRRPVALPPTSASPTGWVRHLVRVALISTTALVGSGLGPQHPAPPVSAATATAAGSVLAVHPDSPAMAGSVLRSSGRDTPYSVAARLGDAGLRDRIIALNRGAVAPDGTTWNGGVFPRGMAVTVPDGLLGQRTTTWTTYTVAHGDSVYRIAARLADGDGRRVRELADEIIERNLGRVMVDGSVFDDASLIRIGWQLEIPTHGAAPAPAVGGFEHTVRAGDSYWSIAEEQLAVTGAPPSGALVAALSDALIDENAPRLGHDVRALIIPGEVVRWPDPEPAAEAEAVSEFGVEGLPAADVPLADVPASAPVLSPPSLAPPPAVREPVTPALVPPLVTPAMAPPVTEPADAAGPAALEPGPAVPTTDSTPARAPISTSLGAALLLCAGALGLVESRRRHQLRRSTPHARQEPPAERLVVTERLLRSLDATERAVRLDLALRSAGHALVGSGGFVLAAVLADDGTITLVLDRPGHVATDPWIALSASGLSTPRWVLPGEVATEQLVDDARLAGQPCPALVHLGALVPSEADPLSGELMVDVEAFGLVCVDAPSGDADAVIRTIATSLAASPVGETLRVVTHQVDTASHLGNVNAESADTLDGALDRAASSLGSTPITIGRRRTFELRCRGTGGEAWEPVVVVSGAGSYEPAVLADLVAATAGGGRGLAVVLAHSVPGASLNVRATPRGWTLDELGLTVVPVGLTVEQLASVHDLLDAAERPLATGAVAESIVAPVTGAASPSRADFREQPWALVVHLLGEVSVTTSDGTRVQFERGKALELVAWLSQHRGRPTRSAARTALWDLAVRDATFANVVSDARRTLARAVSPETFDPSLLDWIERTLTDQLPLHPLVVSDAELLAARVEAARGLDHADAIAVLAPGVELIGGLPFSGTGYLWPDAEGISSALTLLATGAATELARHHLAVGDVDGVFRATGRGLQVLAGHEELIGLRMRAHAQRGDLAGVRSEWEVYERALHADAWSSGEPSPKLVAIRRELMSR